MDRREFNWALLAAAATASGLAMGQSAQDDRLLLDLTRYMPQTVTVGGQVVRLRAFEGVAYVARPVEPEYQVLNLYIPETYFHGGSLGRFDARTAPIFFPNAVGGYMPAKPGTLTGRGMPPRMGGDRRPPGLPPGDGPPPGMADAAAAPSASAIALAQGFIVAAPGARGRTQQRADGRWTGKAPAAIVDLKAAVRWLRYNAGRFPGNPERIISNGTSAGGALSALLGASGNHPDYEAELGAIGAAPGRDDIFAVSAYCPITNLAHADEAYEWQFEGLREYRNVAISMLDYKVQRQEVVGQLNDMQLQLSAELRASFVDYVNKLGLRSPDGNLLGLHADGQGPLREHIAGLLVEAARKARASGTDLSGTPWLRMQAGQPVALDFAAYVRTVGRMKSQPAFDGLALETGENQLFGDATTDKRHFTSFSARHSKVAGAAMADARTVKAMDAMQQIDDPRSLAAGRWRIRQGTLDRDTSLAVPALLAAAARQRGAAVDLEFAWGRPHSGDYDLDALFAWIHTQVEQATS
ncbi:carboxylesterase family protein [Herbaspirillum sp. DW155]|uniref:subtype B tannase n=1 Tax=Herbaspirillum sp. DW155 TaxID=3095609 RepID=UPI00308EB187|nr:carboxylesterase family protein [Herbaspirillum sp. DW155]